MSDKIFYKEVQKYLLEAGVSEQDFANADICEDCLHSVLYSDHGYGMTYAQAVTSQIMSEMYKKYLQDVLFADNKEQEDKILCVK